MIKKYLNSKYMLYLSFFIMLIVILFVKNIHFEPEEVGRIGQILHPEYPKGGLSYDPHYNYDYIAVSAARWFGYENNLLGLAKIFWFLEMALAVAVLIKLCNFIFKNDKLILTIVVMMFILSQSGQIDQKTMLRPLYFLAIYYFLKEKWLISAIFVASIFYLHVGSAVWWFLPSCFALAVISLSQKRISLRQIINYPLAVIILTSPIIYFYLEKVQASAADEFTIYYICGSYSSVISALTKSPGILIGILLMVAVLLTGYTKAKKAGYENKNIMPIAIGVLILYIVNFVFVDMLRNGTAITLQLLRSILNIEFFASLFFAFLLAKQIRRGNYIFFLAFVLISFNYPLMRRFFGSENQLAALNIFYFTLLIYEVFESRYLKDIATKGNRLLQQPVVISIFLIFVTIPQLQILRPCARSIFNIPQHANVTMRESLFGDIVDFTNERIADKNAVLVVPFLENDFEYYANHKTFITFYTPFADVQEENKASDFKHILEDDLNYSLERLFEDNDNKSFYKKWGRMWKNLDEDVIRHWKKKYGVTHVIRERDLPLDFPVLHQNQFYIVYEID